MEVVDAADGGKKKKVKPGSFQGLGLSQPTYKAIMRMGYRMPTPIQRKTIPTILEGQDVVAMARTGSGKTAAFLIPLVERLKEHSVAVGVRGVVLSPTRELAMQTAKVQRQLGKYSGLRCCLLVGGQAMESQFAHLANNPDVIVATPGRLTHHMLEAELSLSRVEMLIMDEADRLFELGFAEQLQQVLQATPVSRQVMLFSATLPSQLVSFSRSGIKNPHFVRLDVETTLSEALDLQFLYVRKGEKLAAAVSVLRRLSKGGKNTIMFVATKHHVEFFGELLRKLGMSAAMVYGSMDQVARQTEVSRFRKGEANILITTDVAARGIDIPMLDHVINFDFPPSSKLFVHRSGRTARAGRSGLAVSLVTMDDLPYTVELMLFLGQKLSIVGGAPSEDAQDAKKTAMLGAVPALEHEVEQLENILTEDDTAIKSLYKSMMSSYHLYNKTRPSASKSSVLRAKELLEACGGVAQLQGLVHPAFKDSENGGRGVGAACSDVTGLAYIQELRGYRPKAEKVGSVISFDAARTMELAKGDIAAIGEATAKREERECRSFLTEAPRNRNKASRKRKLGAEDAAEGAQGAEGAKSVEKGPRLSKKARQQQKAGGVVTPASGAADGDDFDGFDVQVDGQAVDSAGTASAAAGEATGAKGKKAKAPQFYLSVERDQREEAKERGLDMEQYQMDMIQDEDGGIKSSKSVIRWDAKKKKYLPVMVAADGQVVKGSKKTNESGKSVKGKAEKSSLYTKWAKTSKLRIQRPGEMEAGGVPLSALSKGAAAAQARVIDFGDDGSTTISAKKEKDGGEQTEGGRVKKPVVPFHGIVEEKYLTNKQKRMLAKRAKGDRVINGKSQGELKTPAMIQKEKKLRLKNKVKQNPHMRKAKKHESKEKRIKQLEERQMKYGAKTRSKMLVFSPDAKWLKGKARPKTGHAKGGLF